MKTSTNYRLKLPEGSDPVQVSDLSYNFTQLDTLIKSVSGQIPSTTVKIVTGSYAGDGTSSRSIPVGITVRAAICSSDYTSSGIKYSGGALVAAYGASALAFNTGGTALSVSGTNIVARYSSTVNYKSTNTANTTYYYTAIGI